MSGTMKSNTVMTQGEILPDAIGERYIPINKGHFELDTLERAQVFHEKLAQGWEREYEEYRRL